MNIFLRVRMFENIVVRGLPIPHRLSFWQMLTVTSLSSSLNQWYCTYLCHHFFIMVQFSYSIFSTYKHVIMSCFFVIPWCGNDIKFRVFSQSVNCWHCVEVRVKTPWCIVSVINNLLRGIHIEDKTRNRAAMYTRIMNVFILYYVLYTWLLSQVSQSYT